MVRTSLSKWSAVLTFHIRRLLHCASDYLAKCDQETDLLSGHIDFHLAL